MFAIPVGTGTRTYNSKKSKKTIGTVKLEQGKITIFYVSLNVSVENTAFSGTRQHRSKVEVISESQIKKILADLHKLENIDKWGMSSQ